MSSAARQYTRWHSRLIYVEAISVVLVSWLKLVLWTRSANHGTIVFTVQQRCARLSIARHRAEGLRHGWVQRVRARQHVHGLDKGTRRRRRLLLDDLFHLRLLRVVDANSHLEEQEQDRGHGRGVANSEGDAHELPAQLLAVGVRLARQLVENSRSATDLGIRKKALHAGNNQEQPYKTQGWAKTSVSP
jgi:hypothetical protein